MNKVYIREFLRGTQGMNIGVETIETDVFVKGHFGPVQEGCAELPMKEQHYFAIKYLGHWWRVREVHKEKGAFELDLPSPDILSKLGVKI